MKKAKKVAVTVGAVGAVTGLAIIAHKERKIIKEQREIIANFEESVKNLEFRLKMVEEDNVNLEESLEGIPEKIKERNESLKNDVANIIQEAINETAQVEKLEELENDLNGIKNIINKVAGLSAEQMNLSEKEKQEMLNKMKK